MKFTELRYLLALAEEKHFGRAAKRCSVSQPTLSIAITNIEKRLKTTLFERLNNDIRITEIGERVIAQAQIVIDESDKLNQLVHDENLSENAPFRLGVIFTIGTYLLPKVLGGFHSRLPNVPIKIQENYTTVLEGALMKGEIDFIITATKHKLNGIAQKKLYEEPLVWVHPADQEVKPTDKRLPSEIAQSRILLLNESHCLRKQVLSVTPCNNANIITETVDASIETIKQMIVTGYGVSMLPLFAVSQEHNQTHLQTTSIRNAKRSVYLSWRVSYPQVHIVDALLKQLQNH